MLDEAVAYCFADLRPGLEYQVTPCRNRKFGDYQTNLAFVLSRQWKMPGEEKSAPDAAEDAGEDAEAQPDMFAEWRDHPQKIAELLVEAMPENSLVKSAEVAGRGFINLRIKDAALAHAVERTLGDPRCGVKPVGRPQKIVVDYSSPNLAKELHVGTMRSTVIGDSIARVLEFLGHDVMRQNHYGDWGANFGVLVAMIKQQYGAELGILQAAPLDTVEALYTRGSRLKALSDDFAAKVAVEVNNLQAGDAASLEIWRILMEKTRKNCHALYREFNVSLDESHDCPESFYRNDLTAVVEDLAEQKLLVDDNNAKCAYLDGFYNVDGNPLPIIVQKSDEGYNYSTTDLAAIRYRVNRLKAKQIIIVTDRGQQLHFQMVQALARRAGWLKSRVRYRHLGYGVILKEVTEGGKTRKVRFKTSRGGTVKLKDLLAEGRRRSERLTLERDPETDPDELRETARKLTIAALKYADLRQDPGTDYTFNWGQMLAHQGNTGVYILYCYVRIASLISRCGIAPGKLARQGGKIKLSHELERDLLLQLVAFPELFTGYLETLTSHNICTYLYELSSLYSRFWKECPVLEATKEVKRSRLVLSLAVAARLKLGLSLLGIETVERM